jgi:PAS domain S-box-containing protein
MINLMEKKKTELADNQLLIENEELRQRVYEYEETLNSIRNGEIDAIVVSGVDGEKIYSLTSAETRYRIIIEEMNEGAITTSKDGLITFCNARFSELVSEPMASLVGSYFVNYLQKSEQQAFIDLLQSGLKGKIVGEITYKLKSGQNLQLQLSISPMPADIQNGLCIMFSDITQLKQQEKELMLLNDKLDQKILDKTIELSNINQALKTLHIAGMSMMEDAVEARNALEITNANLNKEIIERKLAEIKLREEKQRIRTILDQVGDPIFVKDNDHRIVLANQAFYDMFCMDENSVIGYTLAEAVPENERHQFLAVDRSVLDSGISDVREEELTVNDFTMTIITRKIRFTDESGNRFLVGSIHDISDRKKMEDDLHESETKFRQTFEYSPVGKVMVGLNKRFILSNYAFALSLGYKAEKLIGKSIAEVTHPADQKIGMDEMNAIIKGELKVSQVQKRYLRKDGETLWGDVTISLVRDHEGRPKYFLAIIQDITDRKLAEEALQNSELKFSVAFKTSPYAITITNPENGQFIEVNNAFYTMTGFTPDETYKNSSVGMSIWADAEDRVSVVNSLLVGDKVVGQEFRFKVKNGEIITGLFSAHLISIKNKTYILSSINDITDRKRIEDALRDSEIKFRETVTYLDEGYYSVTLDGILLDHNKAFNLILGFDSTIDLKGQKLPDFWQHPVERNDYIKAFGVNGSITNYQINAKKQNGEKIAVLASAHLVYNKDNKPLRIEGVFLDITGRIHAEEKIKNQVDELKRFNSTMVDREIKMLQLKEEINAYCKKLNLADKYSIPEGFKQ